MKTFFYSFLFASILFLSFGRANASQPAIFCPEFPRSLVFGVRGADVTELQKSLASLPFGGPDIYPEGLVTGYFGRLTEGAVKRFQAKHEIVSSGLPVTTGYGIFGPKTRAKFKEVCEVLNTQSLPSPTPVPSPTATPAPAVSATPIPTLIPTPSPIATLVPTPTPVVTGSYNGTTCALDVEPKIALLGRDRSEATWTINSSPVGWNFYWHDIVNGVDEGAVYGGITNKSKLEEYPAVASKHTRYAQVIIESDHIIGSPSKAVCTTNTVVFEIQGSY